MDPIYPHTQHYSQQQLVQKCQVLTSEVVKINTRQNFKSFVTEAPILSRLKVQKNDNNLPSLLAPFQYSTAFTIFKTRLYKIEYIVHNESLVEVGLPILMCFMSNFLVWWHSQTMWPIYQRFYNKKSPHCMRILFTRIHTGGPRFTALNF